MSPRENSSTSSSWLPGHWRSAGDSLSIATNRKRSANAKYSCNSRYPWKPRKLGGSNASKSFRPLVTGSLFPINVGYDVTKTVTISAAGGIVFTHDPEKGRMTAGIQGTAGLILKFGQPPPQYR